MVALTQVDTATATANTTASANANEIDVGGLFADQAIRVRRLVRHAARVPDPVIDDACQIAWGRLVRHRGDVRAETAVPWLVTTAVREAFKLTRRAGRDVSLDELLDEFDDVPRPVRAAPAPDDVLECRARIDSVRELPESQQRLVWLQALGHSRAEMARQTGLTTRAVDRQLMRARQSLRDDRPVPGAER